MQRLASLSLTPAAASDNAIALSQTPAAGGAQALTLNGAAMSAGIVTLSPARRVRITAAADESARTFTITGVSRNGNAQSETMAGPNTTTADSLKDYGSGPLTITIDANTAGAIKVGTGGVMSSAWQPVDRLNMLGLGLAMQQTGVANWDVEYTQDDPFTPGVGINGVGDPYLTPIKHQLLQGQAASADGVLMTPATAVRLTINSYTFGAVLTLKLSPSGVGGA